MALKVFLLLLSSSIAVTVVTVYGNAPIPDGWSGVADPPVRRP